MSYILCTHRRRNSAADLATGQAVSPYSVDIDAVRNRGGPETFSSPVGLVLHVNMHEQRQEFISTRRRRAGKWLPVVPEAE